jgi:nucleotide-binding universal stress UspA family protein
MPARTVLAAIRDVQEIPSVLAYAARLAARLKAHLVAVHSEPAPQLYAAPDAIAAAEYYERMLAEARTRNEALLAAGKQWTGRNDIACEWRAAVAAFGASAGIAIPSAFAADLVVAGQSDPARGDAGDTVLEQLLFETGRPVLFVPYAGPAKGAPKGDAGWPLPAKAIVAWNGTRESARATFDALPLLALCKEVEVLIVDPRDSPEADAKAAGHEIAAALSRHGIAVSVFAAPSGGAPTGETIANRVTETGADLLVMGAYGRSRWRELVFGGATRTLLASMTCPTLMAH